MLGVGGLVLLAVSIFIYAPVAQTSTATETSAPKKEEPMQVKAVVVEEREVKIWNQFSGRVAAVEEAEIRPQVSGRITKIYFEDGQQVSAGQLLLEIDPRPFKAAVEEAEAQLAAAKSQNELAKRELERAEILVEKKAIAKRIYDVRQNEATAAINAVQAAKAALAKAKINLDHALVKAPIGGQISRVELTMGNLVQAGPNAPLLTSIVANNKVYAEFDVDEQTYLNYIHTNAKDQKSIKNIAVRLKVGSENMVFEGNVHSFDNKIDPSTGTIRARAIFNNPNGTLLPGMFANVEMATPQKSQQIVLPKAAIGTDQDRKFVYVVGKDSRAEYRQITLGQDVEEFRVITTGLTAGEKVVISNLGMVRPGMLLKLDVVSAHPNNAKQLALN